MKIEPMKIGLFVPCYVNAVFPEAGDASYRLLTSLGLDVDYPAGQTCCGQPMANAGFAEDAVSLAAKMEVLFSGYEYVVGPSASCVGFVRENYPALLRKDSRECLGGRIYEICEFIHDVVRPESLDAYFPHKVSIHNSCHGVRTLGLSSPSELNVPRYSKLRTLLSLVGGIEIVEPERPDECCGFGGMFALEESAVSLMMGKDKVAAHMATGAEYITGADSSCMLHMQGIISAGKLPVKTIHIVEILAPSL